MTYANYSKPFKLYTDSSELVLGTVLYQAQEDDIDRVIAYPSRTMNKSEWRHSAHMLEFLALK